tara:strand:+ start:3468 stop:3893 length:426 start_codon:yes stop_codon:yes gene_type:complete
MNSLLLIIIGIPAIEILILIKVGEQVGAINTVFLIFLTAFIGIYYARVEGLNTLKSGFTNLYKNKIPIYEMISGASIAIASILLILPGFLTDTIGFFLLFPFTRKILIKNLIKKNKIKQPKNKIILDGEIIEKKKNDQNEL